VWNESDSPRPLTSALTAGAGLALADVLASGPLRMPWKLILLSFALWLLVGALSGLVAKRIRVAGLGLGLVVFAGSALNAFSLLSKQLAGDFGPAWMAIAAAIALLAGLLCLGVKRGLLGTSLVLASIPASSLWITSLELSPHFLAPAIGLPVLLAGLTRWPGHLPKAHAPNVFGALLVAILLPLPVALLDAAPIRADLSPTTAASTGDAPDIVLVIIDTLRADALKRVPELDRWASTGVRFERCISTAPWTLPSVSSILTGLLPSQHGATNAARVLPEETQTLAENLRAAGYQTAAFTGGAFVSPSFQLDQGFEHFEARAEFGFQPFRIHVPMVWRLAKNRFLPLEPILGWVQEYPGIDGILGAARTWLGKRDPTRPYFLVLHSYEVHDYYLRHPECDRDIRPTDFGLSARFQGRQSIHPGELVDASQGDLDYFEAIYLHRLQHVSGALLEFLDSGTAQTARPRVVALTSDHGEGFDAARGRVHHGGRLHEDLLRVPLVLRAPGMLPMPQSISEPVSSIDLAPTLLQLAGASNLPASPGLSLVALIRGAIPGQRTLWSEERANGRSLLALHQGIWKLLRERGSEQLFDLGSDPKEEHALPEVPRELQEQLDHFRTRFPARSAQASRIDAQTEAHLRSIGYLGDGEEDSD